MVTRDMRKVYDDGLRKGDKTKEGWRRLIGLEAQQDE